MSFFGLPKGIRSIPAARYASGQHYSTALHNFLQHNQELIQGSICSRQLVNDYFPNASGVAHGEVATPNGSMIAQWGRFQRQPGMMTTARAYAAKNTTTYSDDTYLRLICTPKMCNPNTPLSKLVDAYEDTLYHAVDTVDSTSYAYYDFTVLPNVGNGDLFYLSLWKQSSDPEAEDSSQIYLRFFSAYEEPEQ